MWNLACCHPAVITFGHSRQCHSMPTLSECVRVRGRSGFSCATGKQPRVAPSSIRRFARHGSLVAWQFCDAVLVWLKIAQDNQPGEVVRLAQQREQQLQPAFTTMRAEPEERQHLNQWSIPDWAIPTDSTEKKEGWLQWSFIISSNADAPSQCLSTSMKTAASATQEIGRRVDEISER